MKMHYDKEKFAEIIIERVRKMGYQKITDVDISVVVGMTMGAIMEEYENNPKPDFEEIKTFIDRNEGLYNHLYSCAEYAKMLSDKYKEVMPKDAVKFEKVIGYLKAVAHYSLTGNDLLGNKYFNAENALLKIINFCSVQNVRDLSKRYCKFCDSSITDKHEENCPIQIINYHLKDREFLTVSQLWYIISVYPEKIAGMEKDDDYIKAVESKEDMLLWSVRTKIINELLDGEQKKCLCVDCSHPACPIRKQVAGRDFIPFVWKCDNYVT
jgi:hypothetical protein